MKNIHIKNFLNDPKYLFCYLANKGLFNWMSDEKFLKYYYYCSMGKKLNLDNPKTYNEKLQWLKIYDRKDKYTILVDKYLVRDHVKNIIGSEYLIPLIDIYENVEDIKWSNLPKEFVIKCTHSSASVIVCKDKSKLDEDKTKKRLKKWWGKNLYYYGREWPYKNVKPRIICETLLKDSVGNIPDDFKIFCFDGKVKAISIHRGRFTEEYTHDIYDENWNRIQVKRGKENSKFGIEKPENFDEMIKIAEKLSKGLRHIRVDLYNLNGKIYFGELTFFTASGFQKFEPEEYDILWGKWINID